MKNLELGLAAASEVSALARRAASALAPSQDAYHIARRAVNRPVEYMRYAEFDAILRDLKLDAGMTLLDVASPQWFSIYLAAKYPNVEFIYANILEPELAPFKDIAAALGIKNLEFQLGDVRSLEFRSDVFDRVVSISVIEHIFPAEGGDVQALAEIKRVLKAGGAFLMTVPYKDKRNVVYMDGPVFERSDAGSNFFAREYDKEWFDELVEQSGFELGGAWLICERPSILAVDYYEWGPGRNHYVAKFLDTELRHLLKRVLKRPPDEFLARRNLRVSRAVKGRLVNIAACLRKT